jgi:hypothetical protein
MSLESATVISQLQVTNPATADPVSQGDDHLRLIKAVLQSQFPGVGGAGFASPISATETELNYVHGVTSAIQPQITAAANAAAAAQTTANNAQTTANNALAANIPSGYIIIFFNNTVPTGWTFVGTANRMVCGTSLLSQGGTVGGIHSPITNPYVPLHQHTVGGLTISNNTTNHNHVYTAPATTSLCAPGTAGQVNAFTGTSQSNTGNENPGHTHTLGGSVDVNSGASTWQPYYVFGIICSKN